MEKKQYQLLGVMSGTSLDGIDIIEARFHFNSGTSYKILHGTTIPYDEFWKKKLSSAVNMDEQELQHLNFEYTRYLGNVLKQFIDENGLHGLDAICSHGHTVKHEPQNKYTLQIGNLKELAKITGQKVVCDFRVQDVQLGGQGAPLVAIGDKLLFSEYDYCLNLGGFANISTEEKNRRIAYDICAVNTVLNYYAHKLGLEYDEGGKIAASGKIIEELYGKLNSMRFYIEKPPKSLGIEWVNREILPLISQYEENIPDVLHTYIKHIAFQISEEVENSSEVKVLVTGGGAFNDFLITELGKKSSAQFVLPSAELINFKEALIFAFLGALKLRGENNILKSVTGAEKDHSSGVIFNP
ncbi:anhydro-N-acetylmuramic acid kinase [Zunongwangia sp. F363]|uniref:Anhydro-N-acetylmuramic acid kinase n=1 Tax=Autumnicola tepida TaxID=3075595 RepID=A0ABU3CBW3_9FLAO|nr:anhydro-N-acetylmuramic acid kinase [Zunongwangia sp. F363]MDT0643832.1 anhydro-N-acetylmuramic acid kinase [Zunongwangia sp. F363]